MKHETPKRLTTAMSYADKIKADLERPEPKRDRRILTTWTDEEYDRVVQAATAHKLPPATLVYRLTLSALNALESEK